MLGHLLWCFTAIASCAETRRLRRQHAVSKGGGCQFIAHRPDDSEQAIEVSGPSVLFRRGAVAVVEAAPLRYLVTFSEDDSCVEQAELACRKARANDHNSSDMESKAACASSPCEANIDGEGLLSYLRSMAGGALVGRSPPERIAVIGLGSGALAAWLQQRVAGAQVEAIDLSADVIAAAPCFGVRPSERLHLVVDDGRRFLQASSETYDAIFIDAFDSSGRLPPCLATTEFFQVVSKRLSPDRGVLAVNLGYSDNPEPALAGLQRAFLNVAIGSAPLLTNHVALASQLDLDVRFGNGAEGGSADKDLLSWARAAGFNLTRANSEIAPHTDSEEQCMATQSS